MVLELQDKPMLKNYLGNPYARNLFVFLIRMTCRLYTCCRLPKIYGFKS